MNWMMWIMIGKTFVVDGDDQIGQASCHVKWSTNPIKLFFNYT